jgi:predicted transcriptional regulator
MTEHKLRKSVIDKGVKITYLANKVGVSQPLLSMYLSGRRKMPMDIEFKLAKELA